MPDTETSLQPAGIDFNTRPRTEHRQIGSRARANHALCGFVARDYVSRHRKLPLPPVYKRATSFRYWTNGDENWLYVSPIFRQFADNRKHTIGTSV